MNEGADLRSFLETLDPKARDTLRRILIRDQAARDAISSRLMRYRDERGDDWADIIDVLTMNTSLARRARPLPKTCPVHHPLAISFTITR